MSGLTLRRPGTTLLELVVALAVIGLVLAAGYAAFASITDHRRRAERATERVARAAAARRALRSWIAGARVTAEEGGPAFRGLDGAHAGRPDDRLSFLTTAPTPLGTRQAVVRLRIDRNEHTPERGLVAVFGGLRGTTAERVQVVLAASGLEVRYLSRLADERRWLPSWISSSLLPGGVEVRVRGSGRDTLPPLFRLPILVAF